MDIFEHQNLCLYELDFTGSMFSIRRYNDVSHLNSASVVPVPELIKISTL
jgi:probable phosphoglycerate mutase